MSDVLVKAAFQSAHADSGDGTKFGPNAWNAARLFTGGVDGQIVTRDAASATGASWATPAAVDLSGLVLTSDPRLSDARVPLAHTQAFSTITATPTSLAGYGIPAVTKTDVGLGNVENTALSTGNAATATLAAAATVLVTPRAINGVDFNGSAPITVTAAAGTLTGATLAANVLASSLTSVGTLASLTVTNPIAGSVTGAAGSVAASALTGATLAASVLGSSLTSLGTILSLAATLATVQKDAIAVTSTDGLVVQNTTAATAGVPVQQSPRLRFRSQVWNTTATAATNTNDWFIESVPASATTPSGVLKFGSSLNGAAATFPITIASGNSSIVALGDINAGSGRYFGWGSSKALLSSPSNGNVLVTDSGGVTGVGLDVNTASVLKVRAAALTGPAALWCGVNAIAAVSTDGLLLANETAATAGVPVQMSPRLRFRSQVWNTTATAATNTQDWWIETLPSSAAAPQGLFKICSSLNGAATVTAMTLGNLGNVTFPNAINTGDINMTTSGVIQFGSRTVLSALAASQLNLTNQAQNVGVGLDILTDAILKVRTRAQTGYATVDALAYSVSGVAGASKVAGPVTSITVVNGIVTACS